MPSRVEMPEEFYDLTTAEMLRQPEPQYFFSAIAYDAMNVSLNIPATIGLMPGRQAPSNGGPSYRLSDADRLDLMAKMLPANELIAFKHNFSAGPGHTIRINRPRYADSLYTIASRKVVGGTTLSTTPIKPTGEQNSITLFRFAGPHDGSAPAPYAIESFDAQMGIHEQSSIVGQHMKRDYDKFIDSVWVALMDAAGATNTVIYPRGITTDDGMTTMTPLTYEQISRSAKIGDEANLPVFPNGKRLLVVTPTGKKQLKDDPQYARYAEYHKEMNVLFPSYFGSLPEFECFVSNTLGSTANTSSLAVHRAKMISPGAFMMAMGRAPSVRVNTNDNYGETFLTLWLADLGFEIADSRFVRDIRYTQDA